MLAIRLLAVRGTRGVRRTDALWLIGDVVAALGIAGGAWWWNANRAPALPASVAALERPAPAQNGFDLYRRAAHQVALRSEVDGALPRWNSKSPPSTAAEREALVAANAEALATLRQGFPLPYRHPYTRSLNEDSQWYAGMRTLARLLAVESQVRKDRGDVAGAAGSALQAMRLGLDLPAGGGGLLAGLNGMTCEGLGRRFLWPLVPSLSAPQARALVRELEALEARRVPFSSLLDGERFTTANSLVTELAGHNAYASFLPVGCLVGGGGEREQAPPMSPAVAHTYVLAFHVRKTKTQVLDDYLRHVQGVKAFTAQPYAPGRAEPEPPDDLVNRFVHPEYLRADFKWRDSAAQTRLLTVALAVRAFHTERGTYPTSLDHLAHMGYLACVPADPFADEHGTPLRYKRRSRAAGFLLYSVGADGKDDDGMAPVATHEKGGKPKFWNVPEDSGDFVVGVNTFGSPR